MKGKRVSRGMFWRIYSIGLLGALLISQAGCANFGKKVKAFLGGKPMSEAEEPLPQGRHSHRPSYNSNPNFVPGVQRQYKRTSKEKLQNQARLDSSAGSLWVMEGQGAFLFSQNIMRMIGDPIAVRIDGEPREQLSNKAQVVRDLLEKIKARRRALAEKELAKNGNKTRKADDKADLRKPASTNKAPGSEKNDFAVKSVPTRIVERLVDGNYRIKGSQPFMIGSREYKVIVTGVVRAEDFTDDGISASKLIDSSFDIVSTRRKDAQL
jgi:flagellar L-ring protein precursor FlgH